MPEVIIFTEDNIQCKNSEAINSLHDALRLLITGYTDKAYSKICEVIVKLDGDLDGIEADLCKTICEQEEK